MLSDEKTEKRSEKRLKKACSTALENQGIQRKYSKKMFCAPGRIRTPNPQSRNLIFYPIELRVLNLEVDQI